MRLNIRRQLVLLALGVLAVVVPMLLTGCGDARNNAHAVYMLIDTSGTYAAEAGKAQRIVNYLLGTLQSGDSLAVASVKNRSFSEKDIIAKTTFDERPSKANAQKRAFQASSETFLQGVTGSRYTDITGGLLQGAEYLNESKAGTKTLIVFSDMQEELDRTTVRDFPMDMKGIRVIAVNVVKLRTDNIDPRLYFGRLEAWQKRVEEAGAEEWRVVNDLERLDTVLAQR